MRRERRRQDPEQEAEAEEGLQRLREPQDLATCDITRNTARPSFSAPDTRLRKPSRPYGAAFVPFSVCSPVLK